MPPRGLQSHRGDSWRRSYSRGDNGYERGQKASAHTPAASTKTPARGCASSAPNRQANSVGQATRRAALRPFSPPNGGVSLSPYPAVDSGHLKKDF